MKQFVILLLLGGYFYSLHSQQPSTIWLETECAENGNSTDGWKRVCDRRASNGRYNISEAGTTSPSSVPPSDPAKWLSLPFNVDTDGNYQVFGRVYTPSNGDDSFWIRIKNTNTGNLVAANSGITNIRWNGLHYTQAGAEFNWQGVYQGDQATPALEVYYLTQGITYELEIGIREDGAMIDKACVFPTSSGVEPSGNELGPDLPICSVGRWDCYFPPVAKMTTNLSKACAPFRLEFDALKTEDLDNYEGFTYLWKLDGNPIASNSSGDYLLLTSGPHELELIVEDMQGLVSVDKKIIEVLSACNENWLEAEYTDLGSSWEKGCHIQASYNQYVKGTGGNQYSLPPEVSTENINKFTFNISQAGIHQFWGRVKAPNQNQDSFWFRLDGGTWQKWNGLHYEASTSFAWIPLYNGDFSPNCGCNATPATPFTTDLSAGQHTLEFTTREEGTQLDKVYIALTSSGAPNGYGGVALNVPQSNNVGLAPIVNFAINPAISPEQDVIKLFDPETNELKAKVLFQSDASDCDGAIKSYLWEVYDFSHNPSTPNQPEIFTSSSYSYLHTFNRVGTYVVVHKVTDFDDNVSVKAKKIHIVHKDDDSINNPVVTNRQEMEEYLARAISITALMSSFRSTAPHYGPPYISTLGENIADINAKFIQRSAYSWPSSPISNDPSSWWKDVRSVFVRVNDEYDNYSINHPGESRQRPIMQAAVFEYVTDALKKDGINMAYIPAYVAMEIGLFRPEDETHPYNQWDLSWKFQRKNIVKPKPDQNPKPYDQTTPNMRRPEARMWFYYQSSNYIDQGYKGLHLGRVKIMRTPEIESIPYYWWGQLVGSIHQYAKNLNSFVLCDGHTTNEALYIDVNNTKLLLDFHSGAFRPEEILGKEGHPTMCSGAFEMIVNETASDGLYGKSDGGISPQFGSYGLHTPYLVEYDNWLESANVTTGWLWNRGYDEIEWFNDQPVDYKEYFVKYSYCEINQNIDSHGYIAMPGRRGLCGDRCGGRGECVIGQTGFEPVKAAIKEIWDLQGGFITMSDPQIDISLVGCSFDLPIYEFEIENLDCYTGVTWEGVGNPFQPTSAGTYTISATVFNTQNPTVQSTVSLNFNVDEEVFLLCLDEEEGKRQANSIPTDLGPQFTITPNPTHDKVSISWELASQEATSLELVDLQGKVLRRVAVLGTNGSQKLNLSTFSAGVYLMVLTDKEGRRITRKLILN